MQQQQQQTLRQLTALLFSEEGEQEAEAQPQEQGSDKGCYFLDNMKFPDFSRPRLSSTVSPRPFRGSGDMLPRKSSKLGSSAWLKMNFRQQNSLTFL